MLPAQIAGRQVIGEAQEARTHGALGHALETVDARKLIEGTVPMLAGSTHLRELPLEA